MNSEYSYTEKELFALVGEGDEAAFKELYRRLQPILIGFITKLLRSDRDAMEIVQESLLRLWLNRDKLADLEYPRTWLMRVVTNECYRYFRKHGLQDRLLSTLEQQNNGTAAALTTEQELSYRETQRIISNAVLGLSNRQREIYVLSRGHGLKTAEIAQKLQVSPKYVKKTLAIALGVIRKKLIESGKFALLVLWWFRH